MALKVPLDLFRKVGCPSQLVVVLCKLEKQKMQCSSGLAEGLEDHYPSSLHLTILKRAKGAPRAFRAFMR